MWWTAAQVAEKQLYWPCLFSATDRTSHFTWQWKHCLVWCERQSASNHCLGPMYCF